jgi:2,4-dienoyl-CoA reductase-like NADH-dependent reductase (Old Yellow Enzyme family)
VTGAGSAAARTSDDPIEERTTSRWRPLFEPLTFQRGPAMRNRFMLAPMTSQQSAEDGTASPTELRWLVRRGAGGFGQVNTCCAHVVPDGKGFPGELGIFDDRLLPGLSSIAAGLRDQGALSNVQLYHGGAKALRNRVGPVDDPAAGVRGLDLDQIDALVVAFVDAAVRAEAAGFTGVQLHGAHGYLISNFLSRELNHRTDDYGGGLDGRTRLLDRIVVGIRERCSPSFQLGVRLSPERFGQDLFETLETAERLAESGAVDYLDFSLWDAFKPADDPRAGAGSLLARCLDISRAGCRVGVAGRIVQPDDALRCRQAGADYVSLGKVAILNHDYPERLRADADFTPRWGSVTAEELAAEGLGRRFIDYLATYTHPVFAQLNSGHAI